MHKELALEALGKALAIRRPGKDLIHHSDRGSQYCSLAYQAVLRKHAIQISMSGRGNCYDNAVVETFFKQDFPQKFSSKAEGQLGSEGGLG